MSRVRGRQTLLDVCVHSMGLALLTGLLLAAGSSFLPGLLKAGFALITVVLLIIAGVAYTTLMQEPNVRFERRLRDARVALSEALYKLAIGETQALPNLKDSLEVLRGSNSPAEVTLAIGLQQALGADCDNLTREDAAGWLRQMVHAIS